MKNADGEYTKGDLSGKTLQTGETNKTPVNFEYFSNEMPLSEFLDEYSVEYEVTYKTKDYVLTKKATKNPD